MKIPTMLRQLGDFVGKNQQVIMTTCNVVGLFATTWSGIRATTKADQIMLELRERYGDEIPKDVVFKKVAPLYIPTIILGGCTTACIIGSSRAAARQNAVLASLYTTSEMMLKEYKSKVIETIGEKKEQKVRDDICADKIARNPVGGNQIIITGRGDHLCYDALSGRYFKSDIEKIKQIQNEVNRRIILEMWVTLNELYALLGLEENELGRDIGWNVDHMLDFEFSSQISSDGTPCLVIGHSVMPRLYRF